MFPPKQNLLLWWLLGHGEACHELLQGPVQEVPRASGCSKTSLRLNAIYQPKESIIYFKIQVGKNYSVRYNTIQG